MSLYSLLQHTQSTTWVCTLFNNVRREYNVFRYSLWQHTQRLQRESVLYNNVIREYNVSRESVLSVTMYSESTTWFGTLCNNFELDYNVAISAVCILFNLLGSVCVLTISDKIHLAVSCSLAEKSCVHFKGIVKKEVRRCWWGIILFGNDIKIKVGRVQYHGDGISHTPVLVVCELEGI